jgi:hypothetical protein
MLEAQFIFSLVFWAEISPIRLEDAGTGIRAGIVWFAPSMHAGGVADEWVTQMLRQGDAQGIKKYSQMKLQMKREALEKLNRHAC